MLSLREERDRESKGVDVNGDNIVINNQNHSKQTGLCSSQFQLRAHFISENTLDGGDSNYNWSIFDYVEFNVSKGYKDETFIKRCTSEFFRSYTTKFGRKTDYAVRVSISTPNGEILAAIAFSNSDTVKTCGIIDDRESSFWEKCIDLPFIVVRADNYTDEIHFSTEHGILLHLD